MTGPINWKAQTITIIIIICHTAYTRSIIVHPKIILSTLWTNERVCDVCACIFVQKPFHSLVIIFGTCSSSSLSLVPPHPLSFSLSLRRAASNIVCDRYVILIRPIKLLNWYGVFGSVPLGRKHQKISKNGKQAKHFDCRTQTTHNHPNRNSGKATKRKQEEYRNIKCTQSRLIFELCVCVLELVNAEQKLNKNESLHGKMKPI